MTKSTPIKTIIALLKRIIRSVCSIFCTVHHSRHSLVITVKSYRIFFIENVYWNVFLPFIYLYMGVSNDVIDTDFPKCFNSFFKKKWLYRSNIQLSKILQMAFRIVQNGELETRQIRTELFLRDTANWKKPNNNSSNNIVMIFTRVKKRKYKNDDDLSQIMNDIEEFTQK